MERRHDSRIAPSWRMFTVLTAILIMGASVVALPSALHPSASVGAATSLGEQSTSIPSVGPRAAASYYQVAVHENGLASGTVWYVTMNNVSQNFAIAPKSVFFLVPPGAYSVLPSPVSGYSVPGTVLSITVTNATVSRTVTYTAIPPPPPTYIVTFTETGLAAGTVWGASLNGSTLYSTTSSLAFFVTNGTYAYVVVPLPNYSVGTSSGSVSVKGPGSSVTISFTTQKGVLGLPTLAGGLLLGLLVLVVLGILVGIFAWVRTRRPRRPSPLTPAATPASVSPAPPGAPPAS